MDRTEAEMVLGRVLAYLPKPDITDETMAAWFETLDGVGDPDLFLSTVKAIAMDGATWREPPGYYFKAYNEARKRQPPQPAVPELDSGERLPSDEYVAEWRARIAQQLEEMTGPLAKGLRGSKRVTGRSHKAAIADAIQSIQDEGWKA